MSGTGPEAPAAPEDGPAPRRRRDVPLLVFVGAVVLAVVASVVVGVVVWNGRERPGDVAKAYLEAVAAGDAAKALSFAATPPGDTSMLTDEVLRANQQRAPIADVAVVPSDSDTEVEVTYTVGGVPTSDRYTVSPGGDGYLLDRVSGSLTFVTAGVDSLPLLANGVRVQQTTVELFPGSYAFTTGLPNVDWGDDTETGVRLGRPTSVPRLQPRITDAGRRAFLAGAKKLVGTCTAKRELNPSPGCPFGLRQPTSGPRVPDSTVRWRLEGDPWKAVADPEVSSFTDQSLARASASMTFVCTCRYSTGEACRPQRATNRVGFVGDVTTDPMKVSFSAY